MAYTRAQQLNPYNQWSVDSRGREVNGLGRHKIRGYSPDRAPSRGFGGLNEFYLRQNNDGAPKDIERATNDLRKAGVMIDMNNQRGGDTWENRGFTTARSGPNPYPAAQQGPTPDQQRWSDIAASKLEAGDGSVPEMPDDGSGDGSPASMPQPSRTAANPYSRAGNIANAKAAGEFDDVRNSYNAKAAGSGYQMDEDGNIIPLPKQDDGTGTSPFARATLGPGAEEIRARRDFARGEAPVRFSGQDMNDPNADEMNLQPVRAEKLNPYGIATATFGTSPPSGGTMPDYMGRTVPMNPYLKQQRLVQDTKFGSMTPGSQKSLGQDDADIYRRIARGGKIPSTKTAA